MGRRFADSIRRVRARTVIVTFLTVVAGGCAIAEDPNTTRAIGVDAARQDDDRSLEEKVDTDGDGEMSDEEIEAYARTVLLEFSDCMRTNGYPDFTDLVLEDLTEGEGGQGRFLELMSERGVSIADPDAIPTLQTCGEGLSDLQTFAPEPSDDELAEQEAATLEFAACMRSQGLDDWPDPDFAANGGNGYGPELLEQFDFQSTEVQDILATCQAANSSVAIDGGSDTDGVDDTDGVEVDEEDGNDSEAADGTDRSPISPLIEGDTSDLNTAEVTLRDLVQTESLAGTLGYGEQRSFPTNTTGIVTGLPDEGDVIEFGEPIFFVDGEPVVLFEGTMPQFRPFTINMEDGVDVEQLEANLVGFGYADDLDLTVDTDFTTLTRDAVEEFQLAFEMDDTGRIELGRIAFAATPLRIGSVNVELGQSITPQVNVVDVTESEQRIIVELDAEDRSLVAEGTDVSIELPDGTAVTGVVSDIAATATRAVNPQTGAADDATIEMTVVFAGPSPDLFDAAPVDVIVTSEVSAGVLTVPVPALIALSGGGHAVELIVEGGTQLIEVELGDFVDEIVEISGDVREGDTVVMAAAG